MADELLNPLYSWYALNHRKLPWRGVDNPYLIWISEIILQQTRVSQGLPYYLRFIDRFPDVKSLAEAPEDELMKVWEGLGYYSRARNLHTAAKSILKNYKGSFPSDYSSIRQLKGTGEYTAAAVASIAFNLPYAVTDGNVLRVLSRYFDLDVPIDSSSGKKYYSALAKELLLTGNPGMHNQAIMELGALVCTPKNPDCLQCPLSHSCKALINKKVQQRPVKSKPKEKIIRYFNFLFIESNMHTLIEKRVTHDIWKNLYQLPLIETHRLLEEFEIFNHEEFTKYLNMEGFTIHSISPIFTHLLTHRVIKARFFHIKCRTITNHDPKFILINKEEISKFAFPVLIKRYLEKIDLFDFELS